MLKQNNFLTILNFFCGNNSMLPYYPYYIGYAGNKGGIDVPILFHSENNTNALMRNFTFQNITNECIYIKFM